jgi:hypothetical protein
MAYDVSVIAAISVTDDVDTVQAAHVNNLYTEVRSIESELLTTGLKVIHGGTGIKSYTTGDILIATAATSLSTVAIGTSGQYLKSNGTTAEWGTITSTLPTQSGNTNKVLGTDGTTASWVESPQSLLTAQGDILVASAANTPARLAKGTAGQVLHMNAGETSPEWADAQYDNNYIIDGNFQIAQ